MTRYLSQNVPNESAIAAPLRQLLGKDVAWQWHPEHQAALDQLKAAISSASVLRFFDPKEEVEIQADASKDGLWACLMQGKQPIAFASRALSGAEQNYAQIEKELLAIVFALKKFHQYVYGLPVKVQSDHRPQAIVANPIGEAPARLQRMLLQIQKYDINVVYTPGKEMLIADTLSRAVPPAAILQECDLSEEKVIYAVTQHPPLGGDIMQRLRTVTETDSVMQLLRQLHMNGWPDKKRRAPLARHPSDTPST